MVKKTTLEKGITTHSTHSYASSLYPQDKTPEQFHNIIRGHWGGCEIRNHWSRDALWYEDKTRSRKWKINANLALMRCALITLKDVLSIQESWNCIFEQSQHKTKVPYNLVCRGRSK